MQRRRRSTERKKEGWRGPEKRRDERRKENVDPRTDESEAEVGKGGKNKNGIFGEGRKTKKEEKRRTEEEEEEENESERENRKRIKKGERRTEE